jgi:hypothetical protein
MPEERNGILSFGKIAIFKALTLSRHKLPKFAGSSLAEIQKKAGVFYQIVYQMVSGSLCRRLFL